MNKSEFIHEISHIFKYEDFNDYRIAGLESIRIAEIDYLTKLFGQNRDEALNYFRYILDAALEMEKNIFPQVRQSIQDIHERIRQPETSLLYIDQSYEEINLRAEFLNDLSDYIAQIIETGMIFCPKLFKHHEWTQLIKHVPVYSKIRINLEEQLESKIGRPFDTKETLYNYLTDPHNSDQLRLILSEYPYQNKAGTCFMVICLYNKGLISKNVISCSNEFSRILLATFNLKQVGTRQNIQNFYDRYEYFIRHKAISSEYDSKEKKYLQNIEIQTNIIDKILAEK